jgi:hypothetical protein
MLRIARPSLSGWCMKRGQRSVSAASASIERGKGSEAYTCWPCRVIISVVVAALSLVSPPPSAGKLISAGRVGLLVLV